VRLSGLWFPCWRPQRLRLGPLPHIGLRPLCRRPVHLRPRTLRPLRLRLRARGSCGLRLLRRWPVHLGPRALRPLGFRRPALGPRAVTALAIGSTSVGAASMRHHIRALSHPRPLIGSAPGLRSSRAVRRAWRWACEPLPASCPQPSRALSPGPRPAPWLGPRLACCGRTFPALESVFRLASAGLRAPCLGLLPWCGRAAGGWRRSCSSFRWT
jgi:hypothetical protein